MKKLIIIFFVFIVFTLNAEYPFSYFYAFGENNEILICWDYTGEIPDLLGCNLLRSEDYITFVQINDNLIVSNNDKFTYLDEEGIIDTTIYYYRINYVFLDSIYCQSNTIGALKDISFEIYSEDTFQITCLPRQTGSYEFRLYQDGCVMYIDSFEDSIEIYQQPENQFNYEYMYEFIKIPEFTFSRFSLTEYFLFSILNPVETHDDEVPAGSSNLYQNHPNPFNPSTTISFSIPEESHAKLSVYNIKGQKVKTLVDEQLQQGEHSIIWNGRDSNGNQVSSGIYFYKLEAGNYQKVKKMLLVK